MRLLLVIFEGFGKGKKRVFKDCDQEVGQGKRKGLAER